MIANEMRGEAAYGKDPKAEAYGNDSKNDSHSHDEKV
jgi:hypothetical protein